MLGGFLVKRNKYPKEFKLQVVREAKEVGNKAAVARRYEIHANLVSKWMKEYEEESDVMLSGDVPSSVEMKQLEQENDQLKRLLGEKDLEIAILRDLLKKKNPHLLKAQEWIQYGYPKQQVLRILGISRSTYYYQERKEDFVKPVSEGRPAPGFSLTTDEQRISDEQIKEWVSELIAGDGFAYGYRKLTHALRREYQLVVNHKKVYRLCKELNLLRPQRRLRLRHPKRLARNRIINNSNQLWEDIKYGYIEGEYHFFFVLSVIDVYDRSIVAYHIGTSCTAKDAVRTVQRALWKRRQFEEDTKPVIRTDNGPPFVSHAFEEVCQEFGVEHERIPPRTPNMNAHIEAFHSILEEECFRRNVFDTYGEAYEMVSEFMLFYNERRIHASIGYRPPKEFYEL
jgi:putative transposase